MFPLLGFWQEMALGFLSHFADYCVGTSRNSILFWNTLRQRGNNYHSHLAAGQPPVMVFDYEMILDGRSFQSPVNYALLRIIDRRKNERREMEGDVRFFPVEMRKDDRRKTAVSSLEEKVILVIDPRAGHGPGISGSKEKLSQIGLSLDAGHVVYFAQFFTEPQPSQTITHVAEALIEFLEEISRRHEKKPFIIANCQAGWLVAMVASLRPDLVEGFSLNGSPLSYWAGKADSHPMRNRGLLLGGIWATSFLSDLGDGKFDGAHIVSGFEDLNWANTYCKKMYALYSNVDSERARFLFFDLWWQAIHNLNRAEIDFIARRLFIGNELEQGILKLENGEVVDLAKLQNMVIEIFASQGDNITPPPQALGWLPEVFRTDAEIEKRNLTIIFSVHEKIGHLGIFVGGKICDQWHREYIEGLPAFECLAPGIYELTINEASTVAGGVYQETDPHQILYALEIQKSSLDRIREICAPTDKRTFERAAQTSEYLDACYRTFIRPWVKPWASQWTAGIIQQWHPLRFQHFWLSDKNPWMWPIGKMADMIRHTLPIHEDNIFSQWEHAMATSFETNLAAMCKMRDEWMADCFNHLYVRPDKEDYTQLAN